MSKKLYFISLVLLSSMIFGCNPVSRSETSEPVGQAGEKKEVSEETAKEDNAQETPAKSSLPKEKELDLQTNHPNGTVLRITKVSFNEDSIVLGFSVTNGHRYEIELSQGRMQLKDNLGNQYNLSPPKTNPEIEVPTGATINGNLIFLGRISPDATSLTLTTNNNYDSQTSEHTRNPRIVIDNIPVERN